MDKYFYDIAKWNYPRFDYHVNDVADINVSKWFELNAIHRIFLNKNISIDICVMGAQFFKDLKSYLVCFSGAVPGDRSIKPAPIFSGATVSTDLKMPVLSISDPTLLYSNEISLGWYAGNKDYPNLIQIIAKLIDLISKEFTKKAILFGGSGGGFASLAVAQYTLETVDVCVANPQTSIQNYVKEHVVRYITTAYDIDVNKFNADLSGDNDVRFALERYVQHHDLKRGKFNTSSKIIYLQNDSDWHTEQHAIPFLNESVVNKVGDRVFLNSSENVAFYLGDWGDGHAAIPKDMLYKTLEHLDKNTPIRDILKALGEFNLSKPSSKQVAEILKSKKNIINLDDEGNIDISIGNPIRFYRNAVDGNRVFAIELSLASDDTVTGNELLFSIDKPNGLSDQDMANLGYMKSNQENIGYFKYIQTKSSEVYVARVGFTIPDGCDSISLKAVSFYPKGKTVIFGARLISQ